jgi:hypothetical protein
MRRWIIASIFLFASADLAAAQQSNYTPGPAFSGSVLNRSTKNSSPTSITTGGTFQQVLASTMVSNITIRQRLTINNNNLTDNCWIFLGNNTSISATVSNSILLKSGSFYIAEWPIVPADPVWATCVTTGDILYVDFQ